MAVDKTATIRSIDPLQGSIYDFMNNSYYGTGGYKSGLYQQQYSREQLYEERVKNHAYINYFAPIVNATLNPVFSEEPVRMFDKAELEERLQAFTKDCTNNGKPLTAFMKSLNLKATLHGVSFAVVDNFGEDEIPESHGEQIAERRLPYVYIQTTDTLKDYRLDRFGKIIWLSFETDGVEIVEVSTGRGRTSKEEASLYRYWDAMQTHLYYYDNEGERIVKPESITEHGLGVIPVVPLYETEKKDDKDFLPQPSWYDVARTNFVIFNKDGEIRAQERGQGFGLFYIQTDGDIESLVTGGSSGLVIPPDVSMPPGFASADPNILAGLVDNCEKIVQRLYQMADRNGVSGTVNQQSGIAKEWDFTAQEWLLQAVSSRTETAEIQIINIVCRYLQIENPLYSVTYKNKFAPRNVVTEVEVLTDVLQDVRLPQSAQNEVTQQILTILLKDNIPAEELRDILEDVDKQTAESSDDVASE